MEDTVIIEWTYTPEDYFENNIKESLSMSKVEIADGKAKATLPYSIYAGNKSVIDDIYDEVLLLFKAVQVVSHSPFNLFNQTLYCESANSKKHHTLFAECSIFEVLGIKEDFIITDSDGNVIVSSKADRIREKLEFAKLSAKHRNDSTIRSMLSSYDASVNDEANELVYLYEIRDALVKRFGDEKTAKKTLGISKKDWSRLGFLSNDEPLKQGRHRGKKFDNLREANNDELTEARRIAKQMIFAYLRYID